MKPLPVVLDLGPKLPGQKKHWRKNLSAVAVAGRSLFVADDENTTILGLERTGEDRWVRDRVLALAELVPDLPGGPDGEPDVEGLDVAQGRLWLVGSHSRARRRPAEDADTVARLDRLRDIRDDPNRHLLGHLALDGGPGAFLPMREGQGRLLDRVDMDPYLGAFVGIPAKENGFDVEGLAVAPDGRVFLGLRGPVLRGWAIVLDMSLAHPEPSVLALARTPAYRRHFLDLAGLGVRDLLWDGPDLLVLAGPTMDIDGPVRVLRWRDARAAEAESVVDGARLETVLEVPYGVGCDHAEGIAFVDDRRLLVVYDSPSEQRLGADKTSIVADLFDLPP